MKKLAKKRTTLTTLHQNLNNFFQNLAADHFKRSHKFIYDPQAILKEFTILMKPLILYTIAMKFPLLITINQSEDIRQYDKKIKKIYKQFICERKLIIEFQFEFFVLITVKCGRSFVEKQFEELQFTPEDEREMYCIIIKILLGLSVHQKAYQIIVKKFIDEQRIQNYPIIHLSNNHARQSESKNDNKSSKRIISLNWIQAKMERRKQNRYKKCERSSINEWRNSHQIDEFKENLMKQLKVINETDKKLKKIKYEALEMKNSHPIQHQQDIKSMMKNYYFKRNVIHTEQISSSLELNLMMKQCNHTYTRRNIAIRLTDSTPRFSHQVYQISPTQRVTSPRESVTIPTKPAQNKTARLAKKTKTYWNKMASKMREINNSFQY